MAKCLNCKRYDRKAKWCETIDDSPDEDFERCCDVYEKMTNADRIREMNDEELADIIMCPYDTAGKPAHIMPCVKDGNIQELVSPEYCKKCMMMWLQSEVEE